MSETKAPEPDLNDPRVKFLHDMMGEIETRFTYHPPVGNQAERYQVIRDNAKAMATMFVSLCPPCRETSLALTKLEESTMWANAAIARREQATQPLIEVPQ